MDYARKIGKSDEPKKWVKQFTTTVTTSDGLISPQSIFSEDRRLANWQRWLDRRAVQYKRITSTTGRHRNDQILNSCEKVRPLIEMRNLIDYATVPIPVIPDKYRGGTEFWRIPKTLPKRGPCLPDITFTPSKKELNVIPELTYVDLPELIEKEKDLIGLKSKEPSWARSRYLKRREKELSKEIAMLVPKQPETKDLIIRNSISAIKEPFARIPPITVSDAEGKERDAGFCCDRYSEQAIVLKIQDREIVWQNQVSSRQKRAESDPITWNLTFYGKINERTEKDIVFENKGNRVIVYQWRDATFQSNVIPSAKRTSSFFFNKTKGVILPGQIVKLKIWYLGMSYVSTEFWKLTTDPILRSSPLVFRFWGCAETPNVLPVNFRPVRIVDKYLNRCIRNTVIRQIINDIMENVSFARHPEPAYGCLFLESELFAVQNSLCFYNPTLLIEFHKIYYNATNQTKHRWNMLLDDIREILLKIKQPERRNTILSQFAELYKECLEPSLYRSMRYNKYEMIYNLLCSFFNLFEIESELARNAYLVNEYKETPGMAPQMSYTMSMNASQPSVKSNNWRNKRGRKSSIRSQNSQVRTITEQRTCTVPADDSLYKEIFFIRIYELLGETITRIFASIESFDNLNERDK
ncbi:MYCBP-associated protein-like [Bombus terrestris]|uniref:MYCBP-associated protein-like n=1 Tax=Bombus terrestris TaxID=30195 RepID=A0A9B0C2R3_BOMTE|nr:MYCBP-associated protein-like [Bombus terrestris]